MGGGDSAWRSDDAGDDADGGRVTKRRRVHMKSGRVHHVFRQEGDDTAEGGGGSRQKLQKHRSRIDKENRIAKWRSALSIGCTSRDDTIDNNNHNHNDDDDDDDVEVVLQDKDIDSNNERTMDTEGNLANDSNNDLFVIDHVGSKVVSDDNNNGLFVIDHVGSKIKINDEETGNEINPIDVESVDDDADKMENFQKRSHDLVDGYDSSSTPTSSTAEDHKSPSSPTAIDGVCDDDGQVINLCCSDSDSDDDDGNHNKHERREEKDTIELNISTASTCATDFGANNSTKKNKLSQRERTKVVDALHLLRRKLQRNTSIADRIECRSRARVPIICITTRYGFDSDISMGGQSGADTSDYVTAQVQRYDRWVWSNIVRLGTISSISECNTYLTTFLLPL